MILMTTGLLLLALEKRSFCKAEIRILQPSLIECSADSNVRLRMKMLTCYGLKTIFESYNLIRKLSVLDKAREMFFDLKLQSFDTNCLDSLKSFYLSS